MPEVWKLQVRNDQGRIEMSTLTFEGVPLSEVTDEDLISYFNHGRKRKVNKDSALLWVGFLRIFDDIDPPMTTRQMFYQAETLGLVPKNDAGYDKVQRQFVNARRAGIIPYEWVADNTRWMRKPRTYTSLEDFLKLSQRAYRRSIWASQNSYVEIWIEKDALAGVVSPITEKWDVPLMVTKGYSSVSFAYSAAETIKSTNKHTYIYYFGDYDPSGMDISRDLESKLKTFLEDTGIPLSFRRIAINDRQISQYNLPTRPTKKSDSRSKKWEGDSVELDALRADVLRKMVDLVIQDHLDPELYERTIQIEKLERETLSKVSLATNSEEVTA